MTVFASFISPLGLQAPRLEHNFLFNIHTAVILSPCKCNNVFLRTKANSHRNDAISRNLSTKSSMYKKISWPNFQRWYFGNFNIYWIKILKTNRSSNCLGVFAHVFFSLFRSTTDMWLYRAYSGNLYHGGEVAADLPGFTQVTCCLNNKINHEPRGPNWKYVILIF